MKDLHPVLRNARIHEGGRLKQPGIVVLVENAVMNTAGRLRGGIPRFIDDLDTGSRCPSAATAIPGANVEVFTILLDPPDRVMTGEMHRRLVAEIGEHPIGPLVATIHNDCDGERQDLLRRALGMPRRKGGRS